MALVKEPKLPGNARESLRQTAFPSSRTDGIKADDAENWESNSSECIRQADRYESGKVPGLNVYTGKKGR
jgi:hypothetical protein